MLLCFEYSNKPYIYLSLCDMEGVSGQWSVVSGQWSGENHQSPITNPQSSSKYPVVDKLVLNA
ncbi:hypothetical protein FJR08_16040 [Dolichospermum sp. UHCC 0260]|nr:hypothetical protein [Dolichospermum sp. UHCC 0260]